MRTNKLWRWIGRAVLIEAFGARKVVLCSDFEGKLKQCDAKSKLVPFDPRSKVGKLIEAAPDLLGILKGFLGGDGDEKSARLLVEYLENERKLK